MSIHFTRLRDSFINQTRQLDGACRSKLGVSLVIWRLLDRAIIVAGLVLAGVAIAAGAPPFLTIVAAAAIVNGPAVVEWWLIRQDVIEAEDPNGS